MKIKFVENLFKKTKKSSIMKFIHNNTVLSALYKERLVINGKHNAAKKSDYAC